MAPDIWPITADISQYQTYDKTAKNAKNEPKRKNGKNRIFALTGMVPVVCYQRHDNDPVTGQGFGPLDSANVCTEPKRGNRYAMIAVDAICYRTVRHPTGTGLE